jgi:tetratricopeptide (TPR) repeat protein
VFSWSYRNLGAEAARLFRQLGLHPGPDAGLPAVASLAAAAQAPVQALLAELTRAGLVHEHRPHRYTFHDLLRAYAIEQAGLQDSDRDRQGTVWRMVEYYLDAARANAVLTAMSWPLSADDPVVTGMPSTEEDRARGLAWFSEEREVLLGVVDQAATAGLPTQAWQLAWALTFFLLRQGHWHDVRTMHETVLAACERAHDLAGQSHMVNGLGLGYARSGRFDEAVPYFDRAWALAEKIGDRVLQARICSSWTWLAERRGDVAGALRSAQQAQELYRAARFRRGEAEALGDTGWCYALLGDYREAIDCCERALAMLPGLNHPEAEAGIADSLGYIHQQLGNFAEAIAWCQRSIDMYHGFGDLYNEGQEYAVLGDIHQAAGDSTAARAAWRRAFVMLDDIEHPDAAEVRAKLEATGWSGNGTPPS